MTMAIIACLIVRLGEERYAVPQINLLELVRVRTAEIKERIERIGGSEVLRLRGNLLPLIRLGDVLESSGKFRDPLTNELKADRRQSMADRRADETAEASEEWSNKRTGQDRRQNLNALNILVLSAGDLEYGLVVDELADTEEIVVKPLGRHIKKISGYAGATIMGDGRVAPILDVLGLAEQAKLQFKGDDANEAARIGTRKMDILEEGKDMEKVLVFKQGEQSVFAVPISLVARIERIAFDRIEKVMGRHSIQYRGGSLRLIILDKYLPVESLAEQDKVFIIVFEVGGREIGVVVGDLVDERMVPFELDIDTHQRKGIMGSIIIDKQTVMVLDVFELVELEDPTWVAQKEEAPSDKTLRILLVEDSDLFRTKIAGYLRDVGIEVITAEDGSKGLEALQTETVDMVLTDIEMPIVNGYELVRAIRANPKLAGLKVVALSSLAGDEDVKRGIEAGVDRYLVKIDRSKLIEAVYELCGRI